MQAELTEQVQSLLTEDMQAELTEQVKSLLTEDIQAELTEQVQYRNNDLEGKIFAFGFSKKYDLSLLSIECRVFDRCRAFDRLVSVDAHLC